MLCNNAEKRRTFIRVTGSRRYKRLFVLGVEGTVTEPGYFDLFNSSETVLKVKCLKSNHHSSPVHVLDRLKKYIEENPLRKDDMAWLVIDRDNWEEIHIQQGYDWATESSNRGFALSNPNFEFWLLLHFENGSGVSSPRNCNEKLIRHCPNYDKQINASTFTTERITTAIEHAKRLDPPPESDWPRRNGSTVYRLVEEILVKRKQ